MIKKIISKEVQQLLVGGIIIFVVIFGWGAKRMMKNGTQQLAEYRKQIARVKLENQIGQQLEKLKKTREQMTSMRESSRFLAEVAKMAGELNLKLVAISALPVEKRELFQKMGVSLELDTSFHELGVFISKMEESKDPLIIIDRLSLSPNGNPDTQNARLIARMVVSTLFLTETNLEQ